jgi:hypothetical protein
VSWVYDIGENSDCSVDALVSDNVADLVATVPRPAHAKASFATKYVNRELLDLDPQGRTRIRFSLMPDADSRLRRPDQPHRRAARRRRRLRRGRLRGAPQPLAGRCCATGGRPTGRSCWRQLDDTLSPRQGPGRREVIMLTHNRDLHEVNLGWHPKAEDALWRPELQQAKRSQTGMWNVRYRNDVKRAGVQAVTDLIAANAPWLRVRYAF